MTGKHMSATGSGPGPVCARCNKPPGTTKDCISCTAYNASMKEHRGRCYAWMLYPVGQPPSGYRQWLEQRVASGKEKWR